MAIVSTFVWIINICTCVAYLCTADGVRLKWRVFSVNLLERYRVFKRCGMIWTKVWEIWDSILVLQNLWTSRTQTSCVFILKFFKSICPVMFFRNDAFTTGVLKNVTWAVGAELDVLSWQLRGVTVEEAEKLEDSQYLAEFQRRNFGSRSHKL
jgi:hypothetical protein